MAAAGDAVEAVNPRGRGGELGVGGCTQHERIARAGWSVCLDERPQPSIIVDVTHTTS